MIFIFLTIILLEVLNYPIIPLNNESNKKDIMEFMHKNKNKKVVMEGVEPSTVALLAQRSNQLSYTTSTVLLMLERIKTYELWKYYI